MNLNEPPHGLISNSGEYPYDEEFEAALQKRVAERERLDEAKKRHETMKFYVQKFNDELKADPPSRLDNMVENVVKEFKTKLQVKHAAEQKQRNAAQKQHDAEINCPDKKKKGAKTNQHDFGTAKDNNDSARNATDAASSSNTTNLIDAFEKLRISNDEGHAPIPTDAKFPPTSNRLMFIEGDFIGVEMNPADHVYKLEDSRIEQDVKSARRLILNAGGKRFQRKSDYTKIEFYKSDSIKITVVKPEIHILKPENLKIYFAEKDLTLFKLCFSNIFEDFERKKSELSKKYKIIPIDTSKLLKKDTSSDVLANGGGGGGATNEKVGEKTDQKEADGGKTDGADIIEEAAVSDGGGEGTNATELDGPSTSSGLPGFYGNRTMEEMINCVQNLLHCSRIEAELALRENVDPLIAIMYLTRENPEEQK